MRSIDRQGIQPYFWLFPTGVILAAILCSVDLAAGLPIYQLIRDVGTEYKANTAVMNRGVVCTVLSYFVALLFIREMGGIAKIKYLLLTVMSICVIIMLTLTQCQSAQLAFALGMITLLIFPHRLKLSYKLLNIIIIAAMALTPFIVSVLYVNLINDAQNITWLKDGYAGNRLEIWDFVINYALNSPIYGYGVEATRFITDFTNAQIYHKSSTVLHPHNFSIQIWIEFGIIGIALASLFFTFLIHKISLTSTEHRRVIISLLIAILAISAVGYGLWQSWWLGEFIYLAALCALITNKAKAA